MTKSGRLAWAAVALVLVGAAFVRWRYAGVALERDEGEYAYAGQLILQGIPPYQLAYNMKFPGTYYAYSLVLGVLGQTPWAIRIGLLVINALTTGLVFLIARRLVGLGGAVTAAIVFVILSLDRNVLGVFAHATHFVLLPALAGLYLLLDQSRAERPLRLAAAGVLLGIAVIMKQPGAFFLALGGVVVLVREWQRRPREIRVSSRRMLAFCGGAVAPMLLLGLVLAWQGVFGRFWFWTIDYARAYVGETPTAAAWDGLRLGWLLTTEVTRAFWFLGAVGALLLFVTRWSATTRTWIAAFAVVSFLAVCPGFYFRRHYFVLALPAVAILTGVATPSIANLAAAAGQV
jgi:4-amino-4-deoxy-L-arabinose transferase-like glycosyltransferase